VSVDNRTETFWTRGFLVALTGYFFLFLSITLFYLFPLFLKQFNPSKTRVGLIMGIYSFMAILIRPFFGGLMDMKGRKKISLLGTGLLIAILPWFHLVKNAGAFPIVLRALTGIGGGIGLTAVMTLCSDLAPVQRLAHSLGIVGVAGLLSVAFGPLLGEEIVRHYGFRGLFNASLMMLGAAFLCIFWTEEPARHPAVEKPAPKRNSVKRAPFLILGVISALPILHGAVRSSIDYFIVLFGKSIPVERVGPFFVAFAGAAILTRLGIGDISDRRGRKRVIWPASLIISLNLVLISRVNSMGLFTLAGFIGGLGQGLIFPALSSYVIDFLGKEHKGLALSLYLSLFDIGMGLGSPFFGWLSDIFDYRTMYLLAGLIFFLVGALFTLKAPTLSETTT
jgi:MFS family permease